MKDNLRDDLYGAILSLRTLDECKSFLTDVLTDKEISEISARLRVAKLLSEKVNYTEIAARTGASTATISRVSKCLGGGAGGYALALSRIAEGGGEKGLLGITGDVLSLCRRFGYDEVSVPDFEEYDLYRDVPYCFGGKGVVTFSGSDGRLMAIKPDTTPSIVRLFKETGRKSAKYSYVSKVCRKESSSGEFRLLTQCGAECIGALRTQDMAQVLSLAAGVLALMDANATLTVSDTRIASALLQLGSTTAPTRGRASAVIPALSEVLEGKALEQLSRLSAILDQAGLSDVDIDFSQKDLMGYCDGIVFVGYSEKCASPLLFGGKYKTDAFSLKGMHGIGFSTYPEMLAEK